VINPIRVVGLAVSKPLSLLPIGTRY